ncbi:hypothetical protein [Veillonella ratti]|uniref:hypothetical protein n=1 Tax=Veillonella ratti TaxID=103892 RepID=UPI0034A1EF75
MKRLDILTSLQAVGYRWLVRDEGTQNISNSLTAYEQKPTRNELGCWSDLGYKFVEEDQCFPDVTTAVKGHYAGFDALNPTEHFMTYKAGTSEWTSKDEKGRTHWKYCWLAEEVDESEL